MRFSVAQEWPILERADNILLVNKLVLQHIFPIEADGDTIMSGQYQLSSARYLFDVSYTFSSHAAQKSDLVGLTVKSHTCTHGETHTLDELCPSEYRLVQCLQEHYSLKESAARLNISYENSRTTLKHVFAKLDVHSQKELIKRLQHFRDPETAPKK